MIKKSIKFILHKIGYSLVKNNFKPIPAQIANINPSPIQLALNRIKRVGIEPNLIIDIGAAKGMWTKKCSQTWPNAHYILVEPISEQYNQISDNIGKTLKHEIIKGVCGNVKGKTKLTVTDDLDGSGLYGGGDENCIEVEMYTINEILKNKDSKNIIVKLDTHGYENQIIDGAIEHIEDIDAWIIEVYGFYVSPTAPLFHELSQRMFELGYRLFDIIDIMRREKDHAFWQADAIFLKANHPIFSNNKYN